MTTLDDTLRAMLRFSGSTQVEQVHGVIDARPHPLRIVNVGEEPLEVLDISFDADWVTYGLLVESPAGGAAPVPTNDPRAGSADEVQLYQLLFEGRHVIDPGPEHAWHLRLYYDASHPDARSGAVTMTLTVGDGHKRETRELTIQTNLKHLPVFEGLFSLDWGDANLRGAYIAREAYNPKPVPVLVGGTPATAGWAVPGESDAAGQGTAAPVRAEPDAAPIGTRATLYLDNVQDKFAPVVAVDENAEIEALEAAPQHLPNLVRNLKRALVHLPPYGGLTQSYLQGRETIVEDRFSANAFQAQRYDLTMLGRLLIETTIASLAHAPRRIWDEDGERLLTLSDPLGLVDRAVLTYPPLLPASVREALRRWFREGGLEVVGHHDWDDATARVLHACFGYVGDRGGKLDAFVRRYGSRNEFLVLDVGAAGARLARIGLDVELGPRDGEDDAATNGARGAAHGNGQANGTASRIRRHDARDTENGGAAGKPAPERYRALRVRVVHHAIVQSQTFTGERLLLAVFRLLKLKVATLLATELSGLADDLPDGARAAVREMNDAVQTGKVAATLRRPIEDLPAVVDTLFPTRFRDRRDEVSRRNFTLLTMLGARVLDAFRAGETDWTPYTPGAGASLLPYLTEAVRAQYPNLVLSNDAWRWLTVSWEELRVQIAPRIEALVRVVRQLMDLPVAWPSAEEAEAALAGDQPASRRVRAAVPDATRRLGFAKGWPGPTGKGGAGASSGPGRAAPAGTRGPGTGESGASRAAGDESGDDAVAAADALRDPWLLLGGGALLPQPVRQLLVAGLSDVDDAGLSYSAPKLWPHPADPTTAVALGACEAEQAVQAGVTLQVLDSQRVLQFDIGVRTDRFVPLFRRGTPTQQPAFEALPFEPAMPLMVWYRFLDGAEGPALLGSFESAPPGTGPLHVTLVPHGHGAWTLELTRHDPYDRDDPSRTPSVTLTPAEPITPLELNLYSGVH